MANTKNPNIVLNKSFIHKKPASILLFCVTKVSKQVFKHKTEQNYDNKKLRSPSITFYLYFVTILL